jgi:trehalose 6-phosphate phosphatase
MSREPEFDDPLLGVPPGNLALFLDVDGTMLDIAPVPEAVRVPEGLSLALASLYESLDGALAIISGRPIQQIDQLFKPLLLPASGEHGFEIRRIPDKPVERLQPPAALHLLRPNVVELAKRMLGVIPEFKSGTIALHFRQVPTMEGPLLRSIEEMLAPYAGEFVIQPGKMVYEIKPRGVDKGRAISQLMMAPPFESRTPVFVGDDVTDEYGFAAVRERNGRAIHVGGGHGAADATLPSPAHVRAWLSRLAASMTSAAA